MRGRHNNHMALGSRQKSVKWHLHQKVALSQILCISSSHFNANLFILNFEFIIFFFLNFLLDTCPFLGPLIPLFGLLVTSPLGFKARVGSLIQTLQRCMWYTFPEIYLWCDTSASVYGQHSSQSLFPHACLSRGTMLGLNHRPAAWQADVLTTWPQRPSFEFIILLCQINIV